jgi:hypothetical protein
MSTSFHPETDGASEHSNKTINQAIRYHIQQNQKGWVKALPKIRFEIMNTENASTGFLPFQLRFSRSPRLIPPLMVNAPGNELPDLPEVTRAKAIIERIDADVAEARDNLTLAKIGQVNAANQHHGKEEVFEVGDRVMLSTLHRRQEYKSKHAKRVAKFFPCFDGPYTIMKARPEFSAYTLSLPNSPNIFPTFHSSQLKRFIPNDLDLFPSREHPRPQPIVTEDGVEEYQIKRILDARHRGCGWSFLVRWSSYGAEKDRWLPGSELTECEVLNRWLQDGGEGPQ